MNMVVGSGGGSSGRGSVGYDNGGGGRRVGKRETILTFISTYQVIIHI